MAKAQWLFSRSKVNLYCTRIRPSSIHELLHCGSQKLLVRRRLRFGNVVLYETTFFCFSFLCGAWESAGWQEASAGAGAHINKSNVLYLFANGSVDTDKECLHTQRKVSHST